MKKIGMAGWAAAMMLAAVTVAAGAQVSDWKLDPNHSEADFSIRHMAVSTVHGSFRGVSGVVHLDPVDMKKSSVDASIDVTSVDTGLAARDSHLKSPDFFDVAKFPTMTFKSSSVTKSGSGYEVKGDLTLHGVTKPVVLNMEPPTKEVTDQRGKIHRGFSASTVINRKDFGLVWGGTLSNGEAVLGDDVKITLDVDAVKQ
jgi:polyisoprenoid-binding protein YceI